MLGLLGFAGVPQNAFRPPVYSQGERRARVFGDMMRNQYQQHPEIIQRLMQEQARREMEEAIRRAQQELSVRYGWEA